MAYIPTTWFDEVPASLPPKYAIVDDVLGSIATSATIELATAASVVGTAMTAANMNHIEQGIATIEAATVPAILTAKGDLVSASAVDTAEVLNVGATGTYLIPDSGETSGLLWAQMFNFGNYTSVNWSNTAKAADTTYTITAETEFSLPANVKMVLLNLACKWASSTAWTTGIYIAHTAGISWAQSMLNIRVKASYSAGTVMYAAGWIPLDASGQFVVRTVTTAPSGVTLTIPAYML